MSSSVEKIKEKLSVTDVIGSYIKLEKAGANYKARCPFHNEKTPSFFISPDRGTYYCFGCGAKGDIFTFVQEFEGIDFIGSLKLLAEKAGVTLEREPNQNKGEKDKLYEILERATLFFQKNLTESKEAKEYLAKRGLTEESVSKWRIGFVQNEWRSLYDHLRGLGVTEPDMAKVGLIKPVEKKDASGTSKEGWYDVFRGRIMFPIFEPGGRVVAFSGRYLGEDSNAPKYLNSPDTYLFHKSETLYGLDKAKADIRKKDYAILVEGQFDLVMCHQGGFTNTVATSGTAFTQAHLEKIARLSKRIMMAFDSDKAGFNAANKSAVLALSMGMEVKIVDLPKAKDPAELIKDDEEAWKEALRRSKHLIDFYLDNLINKKEDKRALAKEVERKVLPYIAMLESSIEQSHFVSQVAKKTGIREEAIWNDLRKLPHINPAVLEQDIKRVDRVETKHRKDFIERRLLGIIFWKGSDEEFKDLESRIKDILGEAKWASILERLSPEKDELVFEAEAYYPSSESAVSDLEELIINLEEDVLRERFVEAMNELSDAENKKDEKLSKELLAKCQEVSVKLAELSKRRVDRN